MILQMFGYLFDVDTV